MSATDDIAAAIRDHDWPRVERLLQQLVATDPKQAQAVYDTITLGLEIARARNTP